LGSLLLVQQHDRESCFERHDKRVAQIAPLLTLGIAVTAATAADVAAAGTVATTGGLLPVLELDESVKHLLHCDFGRKFGDHSVRHGSDLAPVVNQKFLEREGEEEVELLLLLGLVAVALRLCIIG
tara:strand:- start:516 stop:893 length:378 start_codon:yes stop_codon:yes gene_type:complete